MCHAVINCYQMLSPERAMTGSLKLALAACALFLSSGLAAQTFKCVDAYGKVTYSGKACKELGLKDGGEVKDLLNINPAVPAPARSDKAAPSPAPAPAASAPPPPPPAAEAPAEPAAPERRCFVINTPKGPATRC